jgi:hypothetical protein
MKTKYATVVFIGIAVLVIVGYLHFSNKKQEDKLEGCFDYVQYTYEMNWNNSCKTQGKRTGCTLDSELAKRHDSLMRDMKNDCFRKYK